MKAICYLRVARSSRGFVFGATSKPSTSPLTSGGRDGLQLATRQFKLVLDLPPNAFSGIDGVVEVGVPESVLQTVVQTEVESGTTGKGWMEP